MSTWLIWASAVVIKATTFDKWTSYVIYIIGPTPPSSENQAFKHSSSFQLDRSLSALLFHLRSYFHFGLKQLCTASHCLCFASIRTASWRTAWRKNVNDFSSIVSSTKIARHLFCPSITFAKFFVVQFFLIETYLEYLIYRSIKINIASYTILRNRLDDKFVMKFIIQFYLNFLKTDKNFNNS